MLIKRYVFSLLLFYFVLNTSQAAVELELTQGISGSLPIMIVPFTGESQLEIDEQISQIISDDLGNSGRFRVIPVPAELAEEGDSLTELDVRGANISSWVKGSVALSEDEQIAVNFQLIDPYGQNKILLSEKFQAKQADARQLAHRISDSIFEQLIGVRGIFSTRIAYVVIAKQADGKPRYSLEIADADGYNSKPLFVSPEPIMSPSWSPNGKEIAYVSFENKQSEVYVINIESGERRIISDYPGINGAPAYSPNGKEISLVLSKDGSPKLYIVNLENLELRRLTDGYAIDTEPNWAPDGNSILFTSDRGGTPQVYQLDLVNQDVERMTFEGRYNARPAYTPDGKSFIMLHQTRDGRFNIAIQSIGSDNIDVISTNGYTDSPSLAPNGKMVIYAAVEGSRRMLNIASTDGRVKIRLPAREGEVQEPAWSGYLN